MLASTTARVRPYLHERLQLFLQPLTPLLSVARTGFCFEERNARESLLRYFVDHLERRGQVRNVRIRDSFVCKIERATVSRTESLYFLGKFDTLRGVVGEHRRLSTSFQLDEDASEQLWINIVEFYADNAR